MQRRTEIPAMIVVLLTMMFSSVLAQTGHERRVSFQRGRSSAIVKGVIGSDDTITYLIGARAGQTMDLDISKGAAFRLFTPSGEALQGGKGVSGATEDLEETGDYRIEVEHRSQKKSVAFTLKVAIR